MNDARKVRNHVTLRSQIGTEILILAKTFQEGRVPNFGTFEPKNERSVTTCDFTEGGEGVFFMRDSIRIGFDNVSYRNRFSGKHEHE